MTLILAGISKPESINEREIDVYAMLSIKDWQKRITKYAIGHGFNWTPNDIDRVFGNRSCDLSNRARVTQVLHIRN